MLCNITTDDIVEFRNKKAEENSNISANKYLSIIKRVFKIGKKLNAVVVDPAEGISMLSEKEHERNRFLLPHEIDLLIESAKKVRAKHYLPAMIYLGAEHGASKQEILSLVWSDIDLNFKGNGLIRFYRTKNKKGRTDRLMPRTKMALMEWKDHFNDRSVFPSYGQL